MPRNQHETLRALGERNAGVARDHAGEPRARRRRRKHHSISIHYVHAGGVLGHQLIVDLNHRHFALGRMFARLAVDLSRQEILRGTRCNQLAALRSVILREQRLRRNVVIEFRIAVIGVAIGIRQLQRLGGAMDIFRGVQRRLARIETLQDVKRLQHRWSLRPEAGLVNLVALISRRNRLFHF